MMIDLFLKRQQANGGMGQSNVALGLEIVVVGCRRNEEKMRGTLQKFGSL